jgi:hypothetical protein
MRDFRIDEISAVTKPAQKGARALIMKRDFSEKEREKDADTGAALPDGSFPIQDKKDLSNAIRAIGRAKDPEKAKAHIKRRAKALGASDMIPDTWKSADHVSKGLIGLTEPTFGHAHSFMLDHITLAQGGGITSGATESDQDSYHSHPFAIDADGRIRIGMAADHDHAVEGTVEDILMGSVPDEDGDGEQEMETGAGELAKAKKKPKASANDREDEEDTEDGENENGEEEAEKSMNKSELAELHALAVMTDMQKAHYAKLDAGDKEAFVKMSASERKTAVAKAREADPVIYKCKATGEEFRASDNPALVRMAKSVDGLTSALEVTRAQSEEKSVEDLVSKLSHIGMPIEKKRDLAKSVLGIADEGARALAIEGLMAGKETVEKLFKAVGVPTVGKGVTAPATSELDQMAADYAKSAGVPYFKAYDHVIQTPRGQQLYAQTIN